MSCTRLKCESGGGFNLWTDVMIPVIISPILLIIKVLFDKYQNKRNNALLLKNKENLEKIKYKLKNFYWPLYIRLVKDYHLWTEFKIYDEEFYTNINESPVIKYNDNDKYLKCEYVPEDIFNSKDIFSTNKTKIHYCNNVVHLNCNYNGPRLCFKHRNNYCELKYKNNLTGDIVGNVPGLNVRRESSLNIISLDDSNISDELTDIIKNELIQNQFEINKIIIENISIAQPNSFLGKQLIQLLKFILITKGIIASNQLNPYDYNANYPKLLLPYIEKKVFELQKDYNNQINSFYYY